MKLRANADAIAAIIAADTGDEPPSVMKPLYIRRNAFDVDLAASIYRIVPLDHLLEDITHAQLTHTRISLYKTGDSSENPLLNRAFPDPVTGDTLTLNGAVENMFASCWSVIPLDGTGDWASFSHGLPSVRIESSAGQLLMAAMSESNPYYSLQHAIGKVHYFPEEELEAYFSDPDYSKHLDGLGHGIHVSLMRLGTDMQPETEVRLVYDFMPLEPWVRQNVCLVEEHVKVPFDWRDTIRSIVVGPFVRSGGQKVAEHKFQELGIVCPISTSVTRAYSG